jgi:phage terminase large subunit
MTTLTTADPVKLAEYAFGHDHWEVPQEILRAIFQPRARVAVKSCHASSKTFTAADALLLALLMGGDVITTAPTWTQVEQVLFGQVHAAIVASKIPVSEWGTINRTEIRLPTGEFALGLSTDLAVRFQGYHARPNSFLLVIFDEAPGVRTDIYEAVEGISAGGDVRLLLLGNPTIASGPFFDVFATDPPGWRRFTIDAFTTPNLYGLSIDALLELGDDGLDLSRRPYLVTRRWVRDRYQEWGVDHPLWQSRVRGQFPLQADDALISLAWCEAARLREPTRSEHQPVVAGVDVAGPGEDETALCVRRGSDILEIRSWATPDARGEVVASLRSWMSNGLARVNVDVVGIGYHFATHLRDVLPEGIAVREVNVGERPTTDEAGERYANLKAELYWGLRERFRDGDVTGLTDQTALAQLVSVRYEHDGRGKIVIESKEKARKRGVKSPDRAEALMLAFAPEYDPAPYAALYGRTIGSQVGY